MPWLQIKIPARAAEADAVAEALEACGALAITVEGVGAEERLQSALERTPLWDETRVTGLFAADADPARVIAAVRRVLACEAVEHSIDILPDADWGRAWMAHYRPLQITRSLWVVPSWCAPPDPSAVNIVLDPGLAFGTGTHPTTALCLEWLAHRPLAGRRVIDYGCGSGILAIAALKLGAAEVVGVDVDPQALAVSRENAVRNGVAGRYRACAPEALPSGVAGDVLVANILAGALLELAPELERRLLPHGDIALSGILPEQADEVRGAYARFALDQREREGWVLLAGNRIG
ncbi:MAG TPA: 50S ribosomal protein L11 methyltransferase [Burkholderiales bacterium]